MIVGWILLVALAALTSTAVAQQIPFEDISGIPGCLALGRSTTGLLYGIHRPSFDVDGQVYLSRDEGESWEIGPIHSGAIMEFTTNGRYQLVSQFLPGTTLSFQARFSTDEGSTWTSVYAAQGPVLSLFLISRTGDLHAFGYGGLMKYFGSSDWEPAGYKFLVAGDGVTVSMISGDNLIFAGTQSNGLYRTSDEGSSWINVLPRKGIIAIHAVADSLMAALTTDGVYCSTDAGVTWSSIGLSLRPATGISSDATGAILVSTDQGVYRTTDRGVTWMAIGPASDPIDAVVASGSNIIASSITDGVFLSRDGGGHWSQSTVRGRDVFTVATTPSGKLVAGTLGERIFSSTNGGASWTQSSPGSICDYVFDISTGVKTMLAGTDCGVFASRDGGATWQNLSAAYVSGSAYAVSSSDDATILAGTNFGVYRSNDSGATWHPSGLESSKVYFLSADGSGTAFAGTARDGIFSSIDGGVTWKSLGQRRNDIQTLYTKLNGELFAGIYGGILHSTDHGSTWSTVRFGNGYVYGIDSWGSGFLMAATSNGLYFSGDGGYVWSPAETPGLVPSLLLTLHVADDGTILTGAYRSGIFASSQQLTAVARNTDTPSGFSLAQNFPNPFNPSTTIEYTLPSAGQVTLIVYDLLGRVVRTLARGQEEAGRHRVVFDGSGLSSGIYYYRILSGWPSGSSSAATSEIRKMVLLR